MNRNQNVRNRNSERPIPGCLGRMVNLFDLNTNLGGNRLLTDKPHYEGSSPVSRTQSDVSRNRVVDDQMIDKVIELKKSSSNRKSNRTPIKMLIAQEMSKEVSPKQSPPNLVAKLMGLDDLPQCQQLGSYASCRSNQRRSKSHSGSLDFMQKEHDEINQYKDVFEIWQQSCNTNDDSPQKGRNKESKNEKNMALIREKFMEAKRLSTDEKLRQSKQFQDALEVLSSNKDLFLKFLQEPNSLFSQNHNLQSVPPPPDSKRITVLRPSKLVDGHKLPGSGKKNRKQINETVQMQMGHCKMWDNFSGNPNQPTRIVVLKPSSGKPNEIKVVSSPSSLRTSNDEDFYGDPKENTPSGLRRPETLLSSVFSNGYIGDESSFSKSEIYYAAGNLSDSEVMSPTSRHSWDYVNRFGSPYSSSSFSRASYSPESSVCREAKKRLSERWAMMALNGSVQEQRHIRRSSSTLGEMLALSDLSKSVESEEQYKNENWTSDLKKGQDADTSPRNLVRSKSLPVSFAVSSTVSGEVSEFSKGKKDDTKVCSKEKSEKSSLFKGLFFSKSRNLSKQKSHKSVDENQSARNIVNDESQCVNDMGIPVDAGLVVEHLPELETCGNANENQDQPSPNSVLESQFEDDNHGVDTIKYNLIDKSPPIGSITRILSWGDSAVGPNPVPGKTSTTPLSPEEEEEQECFLYAQALLSAAGIDNGVHSDSFLARWHSSESPLDPSLRDKYISLTGNEPPVVHPIKQKHQRYQRSFQKLVFDSVNEALICCPKDNMVVDHMWAQMKKWISGEERCICNSDDDEDGDTSTALVVERVVKKEVLGQVWTERLRFKIDEIKKEIEEKLVEELVEESVLEFSGRVILAYTL